MMSQPIQPNDKLIDEVAKRVAYKGLQQLEKAVDQMASGGTSAAAYSNEKIEALSSMVCAATSSMMNPDDVPVIREE
jgi:hypothetical protein